MKIKIAATAFALFGAASFTAPVAAQSDAQIRQQIVRDSIASYSGACPCPYSTMRNGNRCGGRSAYSRPGGESPRCFPGDVSAAEVGAYRAARR